MSCLLHVPRGWLSTHKPPSLSSPRGLSLLHARARSAPVPGVSPDPGERLLLALQGCASLRQPPKASHCLGTILGTLPGGHGHILGSCEPAGAKMPPLVGSRAPRGSQRDHCMGLAAPGTSRGSFVPRGQAAWGPWQGTLGAGGLRVGTLRVSRGVRLGQEPAHCCQVSACCWGREQAGGWGLQQGRGSSHGKPTAARGGPTSHPESSARRAAPGAVGGDESEPATDRRAHACTRVCTPHTCARSPSPPPGRARAQQCGQDAGTSSGAAACWGSGDEPGRGGRRAPPRPPLRSHRGHPKPAVLRCSVRSPQGAGSSPCTQ